jgi:hypothetical protein
VKECKVEYQNTNIHPRKNVIAREIVDSIREISGRFVKRVEPQNKEFWASSKLYELVNDDDTAILKKVKKSSRARARKRSTVSKNAVAASYVHTRSSCDDEAANAMHYVQELSNINEIRTLICIRRRYSGITK